MAVAAAAAAAAAGSALEIQSKNPFGHINIE